MSPEVHFLCHHPCSKSGPSTSWLLTHKALLLSWAIVAQWATRHHGSLPIAPLMLYLT